MSRNRAAARAHVGLKAKLRSWTGRVWRWHPDAFQLMLKLDASLAVSEVKNDELRAVLSRPFAAELTSFALYLDYSDEGKLPSPGRSEPSTSSVIRAPSCASTTFSRRRPPKSSSRSCPRPARNPI